MPKSSVMRICRLDRRASVALQVDSPSEPVNGFVNILPFLPALPNILSLRVGVHGGVDDPMHEQHQCVAAMEMAELSSWRLF
jgi:hypothetical protein